MGETVFSEKENNVVGQLSDNGMEEYFKSQAV